MELNPNIFDLVKRNGLRVIWYNVSPAVQPTQAYETRASLRGCDAKFDS
jgi:hypothetical protein